MLQIRKQHVLWKDKKGIVTALMLETGEFLEFNAIGSLIWKALDAGESVEAIINQLAATYDVPRERLASDVYAFIVKTTAAGLLEELVEAS